MEYKTSDWKRAGERWQRLTSLPPQMLHFDMKWSVIQGRLVIDDDAFYAELERRFEDVDWDNTSYEEFLRGKYGRECVQLIEALL